MDRLIVISHPDTIPGETEIWQQMLDKGLHRLHIRKPGHGANALQALISEIPDRYYSRLVVHHQPEVVQTLGLGGVHYSMQELPAMNILEGVPFSTSCSAHHWSEVEETSGRWDYCLISPVFDSISKNDYPAQPALERVPEKLRGEKIYALGGVDRHNCLHALENGYYGVAVLGAVWPHENDPVGAFEEIMSRMQIPVE